MSRHEFLVLSVPCEGEDTEFNRWYSDEHLPDVLSVPGVVSARRFRILDARSQVDSLPRWSYVAIYTIEAEQPYTVLDEIRKRSGTREMPISDTLDRSRTATYLLGPVEAE